MEDSLKLRQFDTKMKKWGTIIPESSNKIQNSPFEKNIELLEKNHVISKSAVTDSK